MKSRLRIILAVSWIEAAQDRSKQKGILMMRDLLADVVAGPLQAYLAALQLMPPWFGTGVETAIPRASRVGGMQPAINKYDSCFPVSC